MTGDDVGDDHEVVEHIAQLPDEVVGHHRAKEDEDERESFMIWSPRFLLSSILRLHRYTIQRQ